MQTKINSTQAATEFVKWADGGGEITPSIKRGLSSKDKKHHQLYQKIMDFPLDNEKALIPYSAQLAIDNGWSKAYTQKVIKEYKRYLFLMLAAGHMVSPSDQVDQAWHLHMLHSHAYWVTFCADTVDKKLHHWPAEGDGEFHDWYQMTFDSYMRFFGHYPPETIWINPKARLKTRTRFVRIDKVKNWVFPKPKLIVLINTFLKNIGL